MSEDYYKARISELERELEAAHQHSEKLYQEKLEAINKLATAKQVNTRLKNETIIYKQQINALEDALLDTQDDEQKLWELYRDEKKMLYLQEGWGSPIDHETAMDRAKEALKVWKGRK